MKIAIPVAGGCLSAHFGHCESFAFFDVDEGTKSITGQTSVPAPEHQPGLLPVWLAQQGANVVIAGGMGPRAIELLEQHGIGVVLGATAVDPEQAVLGYLGGTLATSENVCDHGNGGHDCGH